MCVEREEHNTQIEDVGISWFNNPHNINNITRYIKDKNINNITRYMKDKIKWLKNKNIDA